MRLGLGVLKCLRSRPLCGQQRSRDLILAWRAALSCAIRMVTEQPWCLCGVK